MPPKASPKRVLVVEDDEDSADLLAETFQLRGHTVKVAHDGLTALHAAAEFRPEVAFLDVGLPDMDGCELARRLRDVPGLSRDVRLVALTGYGGAEAQRKFESAGFDEYLVKPAHPDTLLRAVEGTSSPTLDAPHRAS